MMSHTGDSCIDVHTMHCAHNALVNTAQCTVHSSHFPHCTLHIAHCVHFQLYTKQFPPSYGTVDTAVQWW